MYTDSARSITACGPGSCACHALSNCRTARPLSSGGGNVSSRMKLGESSPAGILVTFRRNGEQFAGLIEFALGVFSGS